MLCALSRASALALSRIGEHKRKEEGSKLSRYLFKSLCSLVLSLSHTHTSLYELCVSLLLFHLRSISDFPSKEEPQCLTHPPLHLPLSPPPHTAMITACVFSTTSRSTTLQTRGTLTMAYSGATVQLMSSLDKGSTRIRGALRLCPLQAYQRAVGSDAYSRSLPSKRMSTNGSALA